jgi:Uma2 family endonuclease
MVDAGIWDDCHVELLNGVVVEMSPEGLPHAHRSSDVGEYLMRLLGDRAHVRPAKPITLPSGSEPEPDIAIVQLYDTLSFDISILQAHDK